MQKLASAAVALILLFGALLAAPTQGRAEPQENSAKELREQLRSLRKDVSAVRRQISRRQYDEAEKALDAAEKALADLAKEHELSEKDRNVVRLQLQIDRSRKTLAARRARSEPGKGTISFVKDIAPILASRCIGCHGNDQSSGNLSLVSYVTLARGGRSGRVITPGNPDASLLLRRVRGLDQKPRMPRRGDALSDEQIEQLGAWIAQGAKCDCPDPATPVNRLAPDAGGAPDEPDIDVSKLPITKPRGNETVSFTKDVAPTLVNICGGCHNRAQKRGGLAMDTFAELLVGGDDGPVVVPGKPVDSLLLALIKANTPRVRFKNLDLPRMPAGNRRPLLPETVAKIETWITEGAAYDAPDPVATLRSLVPTEEQLLRAKLAAMSPEEVTAYRLSQARDHWKTANPNQSIEVVENEHFIFVGNAERARIEQFADWAEKAYRQVVPVLGMRQKPVVHGKLPVYVFADRFRYTEHGRMVEQRQIAPGVQGHHVLSVEDQYICLQDAGDDNDPDTHARLVEHVTAVLLEIWGEEKLPEWIIQGTAKSAAAGANPRSVYFRALHKDAWTLVADQKNAAALLAEKADTPPEVSYSIVTFMLRSDQRSFSQFLNRVKGLGNVDRALAATYRLDRTGLLQRWAVSVADQ